MVSPRMAQIIAGLMGFAGVLLGAYASHGVDDPAIAQSLSLAGFYALIHAGVLACWPGQGRGAALVRCMWITGVVLFSGALAMKYIAGIESAGHLAPVGGTLLMGGWILLSLAAGGFLPGKRL